MAPVDEVERLEAWEEPTVYLAPRTESEVVVEVQVAVEVQIATFDEAECFEQQAGPAKS